MLHERRWTGLIVAAVASFGFTSTGFAQLAGGGLTDNGFGGGTSLRDQVSSLLTAPSAAGTFIPWTVSGDVEVDVGATDSPGGAGGGWQPLLLLSPDLNVNGVTSRLNVALTYSPRLAWYPSSSNQTYLSHTFNGTATATVVPDLFYVNVRGITGISSRFGDTSLVSNSFLSQGDAVQTSSYSVSPYIMRTFGGWGTLTAGYSFEQSFQSGYGSFTPAYAPNAPLSAGYGSTGNLTTNSEYASFATGENLGRIQDTVSVNASQLSGSVFYNGSSTFQASDTVSYAVYRWLTVLATGGYEDYSYPESNYHLSEPTWLVGVTLTPNPDSSITVEYGQTAGTNTVLANGSYSPTARTRIYGSYNVGIQTGLGAQQSLLGTTTVGTGGILLSRATGAPVLANNYLASQYPLSRVKTLTVGGVVLFDRDTVSASVSNSEIDQLINSTDVLGISTSVGTKTNYTYATVSWQHDLSPSTSLYSSITYSTSNNGAYFGNAGGADNTLQLYTGLNHTFTDTLSGNLSYSHAQRYGAALNNLPTAYGGSASQNTVLVGLRKSF